MEIDSKRPFVLVLPFDIREYKSHPETLVPLVIEAILQQDDTVLFDSMSSWELDEEDYDNTCATITAMYQGVRNAMPEYIQELQHNHYVEEVEELGDNTIIKYLPYEEMK